jgi:hypothetical protein
LKEVKRIMATNEVKAAERGEARGAMRNAKSQLAALIMAATGVAIVLSISMLAVMARPLFLVRRSWAEFGSSPKGRPEPKVAPSGESPVGQ